MSLKGLLLVQKQKQNKNRTQDTGAVAGAGACVTVPTAYDPLPMTCLDRQEVAYWDGAGGALRQLRELRWPGGGSAPTNVPPCRYRGTLGPCRPLEAGDPLVIGSLIALLGLMALSVA